MLCNPMPGSPWLARLVLALRCRHELQISSAFRGADELLTWLHARFGKRIGDGIELSADFAGFFKCTADGKGWQLLQTRSR
jgi:hypothetical protein